MTARSTQMFLFIAAVIAAASCGELAPTAPPVSGEAAAFAKAVKEGQVVRVLKRTTTLRHEISVSGVIGPKGGSLSIDEAGITVEFAPGAVQTPTQISITAKSGDVVAYEFQPHGLRFAAPVTVHQSLDHTAAEHDSKLAAALQGSYYDGDLSSALADTHGDFAHIKERRQGHFHAVRDALEFSIEHFSGYMLSTGFAGGSAEVRVN